MTEDEMESAGCELGKREGVAIDEKHACITVVVPSPSNGSPSLGISNDSPLSNSRSLDKINNLNQKEIALKRVGVTREKAYKVIADALIAHRWADVIDRQGNIKQEWVPDLDKQRWGAEMAIKMFGDMIERKEIEMEMGDKTLDRLRALSVAELKARAADLLLGKKGAIDAESRPV